MQAVPAISTWWAEAMIILGPLILFWKRLPASSWWVLRVLLRQRAFADLGCARLAPQQIVDEYLRLLNRVLAIVTGTASVNLVAPDRPPPTLRYGRSTVYSMPRCSNEDSVPPTGVIHCGRGR